MKIGVASGEVDRFLVGDPSSGLFGLAADTPLDRMAATEHLAAKGEIIGAPEVVSATPAEPWQHRQDGYACLRGLAKPFDYPQEPEEGVAEHRRSLTGSGLETLPSN